MPKIYILVVGLLFYASAAAQTYDSDLIGTAGASFENSSYRLDWSVGETFTATHQNSEYMLTQGFQQSYYTVSLLSDLDAGIQIQVFPNPANDYLNVYAGDLFSVHKRAYLQLADMSGRILLQKELVDDQIEFPFARYAQGVYFLSIRAGDIFIKTFKIIKSD